MGAGIVECDVTFTRDKELVCRHAQGDLHVTTDILSSPLAGKCTAGFRPARGEETRQRRVPHVRYHAGGVSVR